MGHEDFFEAQLIEFTVFDDGNEKTIAKYNSFEELPPHLKKDLDDDDPTEILFQGKHWRVLGINRDIRAHGKGTHIKIRLGNRDVHSKL